MENNELPKGIAEQLGSPLSGYSVEELFEEIAGRNRSTILLHTVDTGDDVQKYVQIGADRFVKGYIYEIIGLLRAAEADLTSESNHVEAEE